MKHLVTFATVLLIFAFACNTGGTSLTIEGEVTRGIYITMGLSHVSSPIEYHVQLQVTNTGINPLVIQKIEMGFIPAEGKPLILHTFAYDGETDEDLKSYAQGTGKSLIWPPGNRESFSASTNGYTFDLMQTSGGLPLQFIVAFILENGIVIGPYRATLPELDGLPSYEISLRDQSVQGIKLVFEKDK